MRCANIVCETLIYREGAIDLGEELSQIAGLRITRHTMERLRNRVQLV
jgi:hypothetical protein